MSQAMKKQQQLTLNTFCFEQAKESEGQREMVVCDTLKTNKEETIKKPHK